MVNFSVNTHHAYLNTDIIIHNNTTKSIIVHDLTTSEEWLVDDEKTIRLSAGTHILESENAKQAIIIEDAVKFMILFLHISQCRFLGRTVRFSHRITVIQG